MKYGSTFYVGFIIEYECNKLVECVTYLPFMVKVKCDSDCGTKRNDKI